MLWASSAMVSSLNFNGFVLSMIFTNDYRL